jgi:Glycosyl hydrolase family 26
VPSSGSTPTRTPTGFPASFFTGPLGAANIVPGKRTGALLGTWADGSWDQQKSQWAARESYIGRQLDFYALHYGAPTDSCDWGGTVGPYIGGHETWVVNRGAIPIVNWTHGGTIDSVNAGKADECIRAVARRAAAFGYRHLLRIYWEFNGGWFRWSASGQAFIDAWRRTVRLFREEGATNVGFIWSPDGGYRDKAFASYPGDDYVDWVSVSLYNMNQVGTGAARTSPVPGASLRTS